MLIRLRAPTGELADDKSKSGDTPERIERAAILIHSGPEGASNDLSASNGDISFDEARINDVITSHNKMITEMALQYGGFDKMPVGAYPPVLDQHNDDSNDRIRRRLTGLLKFERRDVPKVGKNVACAVSDITFLGADTVSKVKNGLIYHLSVGINEESNTLGEVSCVIEPAAPGAMVLKKGLKKLSNFKIADLYRHFTIRVGEGTDGQFAYQIFKQDMGHVTNSGPKFNSEAEAVSAAKRYIDEKKLKGATVSKTKLAKLKKLSADLTKISKTTADLNSRAQLAKRESDVKSKFTKLMSDKKLTPAEFKKLDLTKLAKLDKETLETVVMAYDVRESQVKSGQQGTIAAANFSDVTVGTAEDREVKRLKLAAKKNLSKQGLKFKKDDEDKEPVKELSLEAPAIDETAVPEEAAPVQANEEMVQQIEENAAQIARVASMVEAIIEEMQSPDEDPAEEMSADDDDKDEKDLSDDDKKDDDKKELSDDDKKDDDKEESK